jgi:hypothetical protein
MKVILEGDYCGGDDDLFKAMKHLESCGFRITRMCKITVEQEIREIKKRLDELEKNNNGHEETS